MAGSVRWMAAAGFAGLMLLAASGTVAAQARAAAGALRLNAHAGAATFARDGRGGAVGPGAGLSAGYGFSDRITAAVTVDRALMDDGEDEFTLQHVDAGLRVHLSGGGTGLVPYVGGGLTWRSVRLEDHEFLGDTFDVRIAGTGPTIGAGVLWFVSGSIALEAGATWTGGRMEQVTVEGLHVSQEDYIMTNASGRVAVGVSWFARRRSEQ